MQLHQAPERRWAERRSCTRNHLDRRRRVRRDALVRTHLPLAIGLAGRFTRHGVSRDDLNQVAAVGLLHAAERFDPNLGYPFVSFATPTILGGIKRYFRDRTWDLGVTNRVKQRHVRLNSLVEQLDQTLGRSPTIAELADAANLSEELVLEAIEAGAAYSARSLTAGSDGDGHIGDLEPMLGRNDPKLDEADNRILVEELLASLPARQALIVRLRYWEGLSQCEIADRLGISQMHVSRLLRRSLDDLHDTIVREGFPDKMVTPGEPTEPN